MAKKYRQTDAVRGGIERSHFGEHSEALYLTSSFVFDTAEQAQARFAEEEPGFVYSRYTNPTVATFQQRLAKLEGAEACLATSSGMAAIMACALGLSSAGGRIVASLQLFGATLGLLGNLIAKFGVDVRFVDQTDPAAWAAAAEGKADLLFVESPSNPQLDIYDIAALAQVASDCGAKLVVDNCVATPVLSRPLEFGADVVMHSGTKYIDGHGRVLGGALCASEELLHEHILPVLRTGGPTLAPFNAWVLLKGLETLSLRVEAMSAAAAALVEKVAKHPAVAAVRYPFAASNPGCALARQQQSAGGAIFSLDLNGGRAEAFRMINATRLLSITANFGDAKSTITHPASTTHRKLDAAQRERANITDSLVRISVGLEDPADIAADVLGALDQTG